MQQVICSADLPLALRWPPYITTFLEFLQVPSELELRLLALGNDSIRTSLDQSNPSKVAKAALHLSLLNEIFELYQGRIIDLGTAGLMRPVDPRAMPFQELKLGEIGQYLYQAMDLDEMSRSEYSEICSALNVLSS